MFDCRKKEKYKRSKAAFIMTPVAACRSQISHIFARSDGVIGSFWFGT
jgi:hypothetical protein